MSIHGFRFCFLRIRKCFLGEELLRSVKHYWKASGGCIELAFFPMQKAFVSLQVPPITFGMLPCQIKLI